jgi:3-deoxy-D-manno-octulosonic-acid transferase
MSKVINTVSSVPKVYYVGRTLYTFVLCCLLPFVLVLFRKKLVHIDSAANTNTQQTPSHLASRSMWERFGRVTQIPKAGGIHVHCVSVGELNAANGLITSLLREYPHLTITLTTSSVTGAAHAYKLFKDKVKHNYLPVDIPWFVNRFYNKIQPSVVLVTEVEVWPNMLHCCAKRQVPVILINARMTTKSLRNYRRFSWLFRQTFRQFSVICAQSSESFENFLAFGIYKDKVKLSRNMKFDLLPDTQDETLGSQILERYHLNGKRVLLAASTHEGEEKLMLDAFAKLKQKHDDLVLFIVPRHPHRFDEVNQLMNATGLNTARVSESIMPSDQGEELIAQTEVQSTQQITCLLVDTMGWLKACYSVCTVAFVGGSFVNKGGHNALEAAVYAKPIVMGPSIYNNPTICQHLASQKALVISHSKQELIEVVEHWLSQPENAAKDGERGLRELLKNAGAVEYTMSILRPYLSAQ